MDKPSWIVFDIGGVLWDWQSGLVRTAKYLKVTKDVLQNSFDKYDPLMETGSLTPFEGWQNIIKDLDRNDNPNFVIKQWFNGCKWQFEPWKLVSDFKKKGFRLAAFTNNWLGITSTIWRKKLEFSLFEVVVDSSEEKIRKPDIEIYRIVEKRIRAKGHQILFIDDSEANILAANEIGWNSFLFNSRSDKGLTSCAHIRHDFLDT